MTTVIKLTLAKSRWQPLGGPIYINPANVTKFYVDPEIDDVTLVEFRGSAYSIVEETPEEIAEMIFNAEHPQCKL